MTLPLDDGSNRSQTVSWETENTDNLGILPSQQWKHRTNHKLNCNLEKSAHVVVDHESSVERNEIFGMCKEPTPDQRDCLLPALKQRELTTCTNYKEDKSAASLVEYCESKDRTTKGLWWIEVCSILFIKHSKGCEQMLLSSTTSFTKILWGLNHQWIGNLQPFCQREDSSNSIVLQSDTR